MITSSINSLYRCVNLARDIVSETVKICKEPLSVGIATTSLLMPISFALVTLAQKAKIIDPITDSSSRDFLIDRVEQLRSELGYHLNAEAILSAKCKKLELINQLNANIADQSQHVTLLQVQILSYLTSLTMAVYEELFFRLLVQDYCFKKISNYLITNLTSSKHSYVMLKVEKLTRIIFTAGIFSAAHLFNKGSKSDAELQSQLVHTFIMGIGFGLLQESRVGTSGAICAHLFNNLVACFEPEIVLC